MFDPVSALTSHGGAPRTKEEPRVSVRRSPATPLRVSKDRLFNTPAPSVNPQHPAIDQFKRLLR
jgi:hypothetical protein